MVQQDPDRDSRTPDFVSEQEVKILLIGDPGVGKTSLIYSLVNDEFEPKLPPRMADITVPANLTPENVALTIVDYSEHEQSNDDLREAILNSNVICIVYVANDDTSLDRVATHWIPFVRKCQTTQNAAYKPIILVANKTDLLDDQDKSLDGVSNIIQEYVDIEAYIEVSALSQKNVVELFSSAQKAVTYPLAPLFDPQMRVLTKKCRNALVNIFKLCDIDGDSLLSDHELNLFQENCFGTPLQKDALDDLKLIIKQSTIDGIIDNSMTETGFLFLHALSIDKGRHDFTWQVLRKFGYDNQVNPKENDAIDKGDILVVGEDSSQIDSSAFLSDSDIDRIYIQQPMSSSEVSNVGSSSHISNISDASDTSSIYGVNENLSPSDFNQWLMENSNLIKAGLGLTIATLLSVLVLKTIVQNPSRS